MIAAEANAVSVRCHIIVSYESNMYSGNGISFSSAFFVFVCLFVAILSQNFEAVKNNAIVLKFGTIVDWMNIWGYFILFFQNLLFWVRDPFSSKTLGQRKVKMVQSC